MKTVGSLNDIKTRLIELQSFDDIETFSNLQQEVRDFIGQPGVTIGITPFYRINNKFVFAATHNVNSIFFKHLETDEKKEELSEALNNHFKNNSEPLVVKQFDDENLMTYSFLEHLHREGWKSIVLCPLKNYNELIGILEIISEKENIRAEEIIPKIEPALPLFELAMNRSCATLDARIDKIIKENFTAIQPSVEWRFTEAALSYLIKAENDEDARMDNISFDNVYPLYGAIDIKDSTEERNKAIKENRFEEFDRSITLLNKSIARLIDKEQRIAQQIYPHYFERFVTDGVDFNLYTGQSITPNIPFNTDYLKDLRIWQLSLMVNAARLSAELAKELEIPLETTQLVLVHNKPIGIAFRQAEKKFDVDGAYNILYEILKKRVDKALIKNTEERLTQPGQIAIVYSQEEEAEEYIKYLQILTEKGLLTGDPEYLVLEELQGVNGLMALRQSINYNIVYAGSLTAGSISSSGLINPSLIP
jgi:hypothetical protein